jgi:hypothetical protein
MSDEIKVNAEKFDRILGRMLAAKPLSKEEISNRVKIQRDAKRKAAFLQHKQRKAAKKLGQ